MFVEGKFFSKRADVSALTRRLCDFECEAAKSNIEDYSNKISHWELSDIWAMLETLSSDGLPPDLSNKVRLMGGNHPLNNLNFAD